MKRNLITQQDIAKSLNVSRITVSKALRNHPDISAEMKEKVTRAVEEMGYSPNLIAKQLSLQKTNIIGIVIPDLENSFFAYLVDSIIDAAKEHDYNIILTVSREKELFEKNNIMNLIGMRVDGLLVCVSQETSDSRVFEYARKIKIPLVFFDRSLKGTNFSSVTFNDNIATIEALNQLISAGYTKIAHFAGYSSTSIGVERCNGYKEALRRNGIPIREEWIIEGGYEIDDGMRAFEKLSACGELPEIILAVNDCVASGAYKAIRKTSLRIPDDIGILGYGMSDTARLFSPSLSVINQDPRKMGRIAANLLLDEIRDVSQTSHTEMLIDVDFQWNTSILKKAK
jgi:LacI family transcriptional regulator